MEPRFPNVGKVRHAQSRDLAIAPAPTGDEKRWNERYLAGRGPRLVEIGPWVEAQASFLRGGRGLDVACGPGRHTLWLARRGYDMDAIDISSVALDLLAEAAAHEGLTGSVRLIQADLDTWRPEPHSYDLVLVSLYLNRGLLAALQKSVRTGGLLLYTTFHTDLLLVHDGYTPDYLLQPGELLAVFGGWDLMAYEERRWRPGRGRSDCTSSILVRKPFTTLTEEYRTA